MNRTEQNRTEQNRTPRKFLGMIACTMLGGATCASSAQLSISDVVYEMDGWQIVTIVEDNHADTLLLFRLEEGPNPGSTINAVIAQQSVNGWDSQAWVGEDTASVVLWAVENLGLPDPTSPEYPWPIDNIYNDVLVDVSAPNPVPFADGVLLGSPFDPIVGMLENPKPFLELLELSGHAASSSISVSGGTFGGGNQAIHRNLAVVQRQRLETCGRLYRRASTHTSMVLEIFTKSLTPY